ncbi:MAG: hypothetical protein JST39_03860 [Bacteroidetes bacterium]|nr:hypothetical protein [Bacteroidota bacterium]
MNKKISVLTARTWNDYFPLQVVYEWEDILSAELNAPLDTTSTAAINHLAESRLGAWLQKVVRGTALKNTIDSSFNYLQRKYPGQLFLSFFLYPMPIDNHFLYSRNIVPILLDCFTDVIDKVPGYFRRSPILFVTNLEVYNHLLPAMGKKLVYLPLSISDKYFTGHIPEKDIDVLQMGRQNPVLHDWMLKVTENHPQVEYVYSSVKDEVHTYFSTTKGWMGPVDSRADFMKFLGRARVSLLSSPGIDGGEGRTGGLNPVTPRFYEAAVNYCYMAGRYPVAGEDFKYCSIGDVCGNYESYDHFERDILEMVHTPFNRKDIFDPFIKKHLTSCRAAAIKQALNTL